MSKKFKKYLGIDWGAARIGLATGDSETKMSLPYKVVGGIDEVIRIIREDDIDEVVVGEPVALSGRVDGFLDEYNRFIDKLKKEAKIQVRLIDERLTSKAADALGGNKKIKAPRDAIAAMIILQSYLDKIYTHGRNI